MHFHNIHLDKSFFQASNSTGKNNIPQKESKRFQEHKKMQYVFSSLQLLKTQLTWLQASGTNQVAYVSCLQTLYISEVESLRLLSRSFNLLWNAVLLRHPSQKPLFFLASLVGLAKENQIGSSACATLKSVDSAGEHLKFEDYSQVLTYGVTIFFFFFFLSAQLSFFVFIVFYVKGQEYCI